MASVMNLFIIGLLLVDWGRVLLRLSPHISLSAGGTTTSVMVPLFLIYLFVKMCSRDRRVPLDLRSPLVVFSLYCGLSLFWCPRGDVWFFVRMVFPALLGYVMVRDFVATDAAFWRRKLLPALYAGALLIVLRGVVESSEHLMAFGELDSRYEHHTLMTMNLLILIPTVIAALHMRRTPVCFYLVSLILMIFATVLCGSRVGLVTLFLVLLHSTFSFSSVKTRLVGIGGTLAAVLFLFLLPATHQRFVGLLALGDDPYLITRTRIWDMTLSFADSHPLVGLGFSNKAFLEVGKEKFGELLFFYEHPHNLYLQIFTLLGAVGLILFIWLAVDTGKKLYALKGSADLDISSLGQALMVSFAWFLFANLVEGALNSPRLMVTIFLLLAVIDGLYKGRSTQPHLPDTHHGSTGMPRKSAICITTASAA